MAATHPALRRGWPSLAEAEQTIGPTRTPAGYRSDRARARTAGARAGVNGIEERWDRVLTTASGRVVAPDGSAHVTRGALPRTNDVGVPAGCRGADRPCARCARGAVTGCSHPRASADSDG